MALNACMVGTAIETAAISLTVMSIFWMVFVARKYGLDNFLQKGFDYKCPSCKEMLKK